MKAKTPKQLPKTEGVTTPLKQSMPKLTTTDSLVTRSNRVAITCVSPYGSIVTRVNNLQDHAYRMLNSDVTYVVALEGDRLSFKFEDGGFTVDPSKSKIYQSIVSFIS